MRNVNLIKKSIVFILCAFLLCLSLVTAGAQTDPEPVSATTEIVTGETIQYVLYARCGDGLSAFDYECSFDSEKLYYQGAGFSVDDVNHSICALEDGRVQIVVLADSVIDCKEETLIATLSFKALAEGETTIIGAASGVIDGKGTELSDKVFSTRWIRSAVSDTADKNSAAYENETLFTDKVSLEEGEMSLVKGSTNVAGITVKNQTLVSVAMATACSLIMFVYIAYRLGANMQKKKQIPVPLEIKEDSDIQ